MGTLRFPFRCFYRENRIRFFLKALNPFHPAERTGFSAYILVKFFIWNIANYQFIRHFVNISKYIRIYFVFQKSVRKFVRKIYINDNATCDMNVAIRQQRYTIFLRIIEIWQLIFILKRD